MTQSSGVSLAASTDIFRPLMLRLGICASPSGVGSRLRRPLTFGYWLEPTGSMPAGAQDDTDPVWRQCDLESFEENIILRFLVVRCGKILSRAFQSNSPMPA